jgi:hypothetical protein
VKVLYVTGEESGAQVALRARRLGLAGTQLRVLAEIQLEKIQAALATEQPAFCVIDSIQTVYSDQLTSAPGSVAQVRECAAQLTRTAKASGCAIVLVGHVTKEGALAGPRVLEHIVDTVLYFEGDTHSSYRLVRAIKNRFGAVNEIGVFAMTERGLKGVANPSAIFLSTHGDPVAGSCVLVTLEGTPPLQPPTAGRAATAAAILQDVARCKSVKYVPKRGANMCSNAVQPARAAMHFFAQHPRFHSTPPLQPPTAGRASTAAAILQDSARCKAAK